MACGISTLAAAIAVGGIAPASRRVYFTILPPTRACPCTQRLWFLLQWMQGRLLLLTLLLLTLLLLLWRRRWWQLTGLVVICHAPHELVGWNTRKLAYGLSDKCVIPAKVTTVFHGQRLVERRIAIGRHKQSHHTLQQLVHSHRRHVVAVWTCVHTCMHAYVHMRTRANACIHAIRSIPSAEWHTLPCALTFRCRMGVTKYTDGALFG